ncbi:MAG: UDP-N-acetylglucosamine 2-epimerase (hydrolyzing) [Anaerolineae bacterium]|nr:UDP-N-acetylglucosamine 2-epimerase (hydrolyzing) [Anaerolineae bacterium]
MRRIAVVTVARSDYGIYLPVLRLIHEAADLALDLIVTGMHLSPEFGLTYRAIEDDGFAIAERVEMLLSSDSPEGISKSMGLGTIGLAQAYARLKPDILVVLGDRFEMHCAAVAALPFNIPILHIGGGDRTEGAIDDAIRHSITKLSHLHVVAAEMHARRVAQLGEEPWRILVTGLPSLDSLREADPLSGGELASRYGIRLEPQPLLVTFHPVTREYGDTERHVRNLLAALDAAGMPVVFTFPNADTAGRQIIRMIEAYVSAHADSRLVANLGTRGYKTMLSSARAMVGNSSSGLIEAPSFELPVVNVGTRQQGRLQAANVVNAGYGRDEIRAAIEEATSEQFRAGLVGLVNPYGDGHAAPRIVQLLRETCLGERLLRKCFVDRPVAAEHGSEW